MPIDVVKTRLQMDGSGGIKQYNGSLDCAKKLVNVMGVDGADERPERRVGEGRRDAEEEKGSAEAVRGGSRVQPVIR